MRELKTVQEVLRELDTEKLVGTYRWHFSIGYEERVELLDMTVRDIQERVKAGLRLLIERLRTLPIKSPADGQQGLLFVHRIMKNGSHDRAYELVFIDELLRDGVNCNSYAYEFTEQAEILGFLVADTPLTQRYIYDLIADAMHQASFFGFAQEDLAGELEKLRQSYEKSRDGTAKGRPLDEFLDELGQEYGFVPDRESDDERELHHEVMKAELAYGKHSREKELTLIMASFREGDTACKT